jgi:hypothetical protein
MVMPLTPEVAPVSPSPPDAIEPSAKLLIFARGSTATWDRSPASGGGERPWSATVRVRGLRNLRNARFRTSVGFVGARAGHGV